MFKLGALVWIVIALYCLGCTLVLPMTSALKAILLMFDWKFCCVLAKYVDPHHLVGALIVANFRHKILLACWSRVLGDGYFG
eukprot:c24876_g2_i1 orf=547-792(-)